MGVHPIYGTPYLEVYNYSIPSPSLSSRRSLSLFSSLMHGQLGDGTNIGKPIIGNPHVGIARYRGTRI